MDEAKVLLETLTPEERELITMLRSKNFIALKINKAKDGSCQIERRELVSKHLRIIDILNQNEFQNIEIKIHKGHVVYIHRTIKTKVVTT